MKQGYTVEGRVGGMVARVPRPSRTNGLSLITDHAQVLAAGHHNVCFEGVAVQLATTLGVWAMRGGLSPQRGVLRKMKEGCGCNETEGHPGIALVLYSMLPLQSRSLESGWHRATVGRRTGATPPLPPPLRGNSDSLVLRRPIGSTSTGWYFT